MAQLQPIGLPLYCPVCRASLQTSGESLLCPRCDADFLLIDDVPMLFTCGTAEAVSSGGQLRALSAVLVSGIEGKLEQFLRRSAHITGVPADVPRRMLSAAAAGWKYLLPLGRQTRLLHIGCGWGAAVFNLSPDVGHVVGMDEDPEKVAFAMVRRRDLGATNCSFLCQAGGDYLPFDDRSFDVVVVSEPTAERGTRENGSQLRRANLATESQRVLAADGTLLWLGRRKSSPMARAGTPVLSHLRKGTSLPPRDVTERQQQTHGDGTPRTGSPLRRLDVYHVFPQHDVPGSLWPVDLPRRAIAEYLSRPRFSAWTRLRQFVARWRQALFPPAFAIRAAAATTGPSLLDQILDVVQRSNASLHGVRLAIRGYRINADMGMCTIVAASPDKAGCGCVLRLPLDERGRVHVCNEAQRLKSFVDKPALENVARYVPRVLCEDEVQGHRFAAIGLVPGTSIEGLRPSSPMLQTALDEAGRFAVELHKATARPNEAGLLRRVSEYAQRLSRLARSDRERQDLSQLAESIQEGVVENRLPAVQGHGDFKLGNCLFQPGSAKLAAVLDWGAGELGEVALYDLAFLLISYLTIRRGWSVPHVLGSWLAMNVPPGDMEDWLSRRASEVGLSWSGRLSRTVAQYQWLARMVPLTTGDEMARFDKRYLDAMFELLKVGH